jgi:hypothetical protein
LGIEDPAVYAAKAFRELLEQRGIAVAGSAVAQHLYAHDVADLTQGPASKPDSGIELARHTSAPFFEDLRITDKVSQNLHAELALRAVARARRNIGSFEAGREEMRAFLSEVGVEASAYTLFDGSGLSRLNLVTPAAVVKLLRYMYGSPARADWISLLPVGGLDGTLSSRFGDGPATGRIHAKTGSLSHVSALSGYAERRDGRWVGFSVLVNNYNGTAADIRGVMDRICTLNNGVERYAYLRISLPGLRYQVREAGAAGGRCARNRMSQVRPEAFEAGVLHLRRACQRISEVRRDAIVPRRPVRQSRNVRDEFQLRPRRTESAPSGGAALIGLESVECRNREAPFHPPFFGLVGISHTLPCDVAQTPPETPGPAVDSKPREHKEASGARDCIAAERRQERSRQQAGCKQGACVTTSQQTGEVFGLGTSGDSPPTVPADTFRCSITAARLVSSVEAHPRPRKSLETR